MNAAAREALLAVQAATRQALRSEAVTVAGVPYNAAVYVGGIEVVSAPEGWVKQQRATVEILKAVMAEQPSQKATYQLRGLHWQASDIGGQEAASLCWRLNLYRRVDAL